ncbi:hypothetical protein [Winogradskyella sp.]|uniref:hypothetical protein n=1 Tax=Winogradskyella sp. TaxID=1883156 RepID=UPI003BA885D3
MFKKIAVILTLLCLWSSSAQFEWTPAKVILKTGESFRGLVKFPKHLSGIITIGSSKFKFKKNRKSKVRKLGHDTVYEVIFGDEDFTTVHFKYVPVSKNRFILMEEIIYGRVSLFARTVLTTYTERSPFGSEFDRTIYYDDIDYYFKRDTEDIATHINNVPTNAIFRRVAKKYFADCEKIVGYLEDELYKLKDLIELVEDYNLLCD